MLRCNREKPGRVDPDAQQMTASVKFWPVFVVCTGMQHCAIVENHGLTRAQRKSEPKLGRIRTLIEKIESCDLCSGRCLAQRLRTFLNKWPIVNAAHYSAAHSEHCALIRGWTRFRIAMLGLDPPLRKFLVQLCKKIRVGAADPIVDSTHLYGVALTARLSRCQAMENNQSGRVGVW
ncbi:MAG: hypothetical protein OEQ39_01325 [Gammaproteobacteria bacterium]|nr:hypothetical protein [Gammaproteobacteria bacterium]MDH3466352.1 hypothetical protein [Gammaproteobacteria bacterium]